MLAQKQTRKHRQNTRLSKEKIKKAHFLSHPLVGCSRELLGTQQISQAARREQQGLVYTSQLRRRKVHRFEPWPDEYSIKHVVRSQRSGALVASGFRGGESSVSCVGPVSPLLCSVLMWAEYVFLIWIRGNGHTTGRWKGFYSRSHIGYVYPWPIWYSY